jgi:rare lipoprotein A
LFLSACASKKVQVRIPTTNPPSTSSAPSTSPSIPSNELQGLASYYAEPYHGRRTASGEIFDTYNDMTAAHRTLPFKTVVRVKNENNGREVDVRINDRGPFVDGRVIDLSLRAAREIDMVRAGTAPVKLTILTAGIQSPTPQLYTVQVGAFENAHAAQDLKRQLEKKYPGVSVQSSSGAKTLYRVRVGGDADIDTAHKLAARLKDDDLEAVVVRAN